MRKFLLLLLIIFTLAFPKFIFAAEGVMCDNRYATLINPVRGRDLWVDKSLDPLKVQYNAIKQNNFSATWLLQYDALIDKELLAEIQKFDQNQEKGVFLEVSPKYAEHTRIIYPHDAVWYSPKAVFLSSYTQSERRALIDKVFSQFKAEFGFYPKSVGAWWIDSYSLNYMKEKYGIKAALIVADQKTTDNYGVWGQWWGVPYYPSLANILTPASRKENKQDVVVLQWALRDPVLAIGEGPKFSNYSMQANDYIRQGKKTDYFQSLLDIYLDCQNKLGQVTVGLETGSDSVVYAKEYENQLKVLNNMANIKKVTMSEFYENFKQVYQNNPKQVTIGSGDSKWIMRPEKRVNESIGEIITYNPDISFDDYFIQRKDEFLNRVLPSETESLKPIFKLPISPTLLIMALLGGYSFWKRKFKTFVISVLFTISSFGLVLKSNQEFGWWVYYGPKLQPLYLYQAILPIISFVVILLLDKTKKINLWLIPLSFAIDPIVQNFRVSFISEKYYIGFLMDVLRFVGINFNTKGSLEFINTDLPSYLAAGLLKIDFIRVWQSTPLYLVLYPALHILLAIFLNWVLKRSFKAKRLITLLLLLLYLLHVLILFNANPLAVQLFK